MTKASLLQTRPPTVEFESTSDSARVLRTLLANVDAWVDGQISDRLTRPAAICCLIEERP